MNGNAKQQYLNTRRDARADLIRDAHEFLAVRGLSISNSKVVRIVKRFQAAPPKTDFSQFMTDAVLHVSIAHADPTADTAVRNVLREAS